MCGSIYWRYHACLSQVLISAMALIYLYNNALLLRIPLRYKTLEDVEAAAAREIAEAGNLDCAIVAQECGWATSKEEGGEPTKPTKPTQIKLETAEDLNDPIRDLRDKFAVGGLYFEKVVGACTVYKLLSLTADDGARFVRCANPFEPNPQNTIKECKVGDLARLWAVRNAVVPSMVPAENFSFSKCSAADDDTFKSKIFLKLADLGREADAKYEGKLKYGADPSEVHAMAVFAKGELQLPAVTLLAGINPCSGGSKETPLAFCDKRPFTLRNALRKMVSADVETPDS